MKWLAVVVLLLMVGCATGGNSCRKIVHTYPCPGGTGLCYTYGPC